MPLASSRHQKITRLWDGSGIDITSIRPVDADGEPVETIGSFALQPIDEETGGVTDETYSHSYGLYENTGWALNDEEISAGTRFIKPGESFFVSNGFGESFYLQLPCPVK